MDNSRDISSFNIDPYATAYHHRLDVPLFADIKTIRKAGKIASKQYHPDGTTDTQGDEAFIQISEARDVLLDENTREIYQLFCVNFGDVEGTEKYERWQKRGKIDSGDTYVQSKKQAIDETYIPVTEIDTTTVETGAELKSNYFTQTSQGSEGANTNTQHSHTTSNTPGTTPTGRSADDTVVDDADSETGGGSEATHPTPSSPSPSSSTQTNEDTSPADGFSFSQDTTALFDIMLGGGEPSVVDSSGGTAVSYTGGPVNEITISGLYSEFDIRFDISNGKLILPDDVETEYKYDWYDLPDRGIIRIEVGDKFVTIDLSGGSTTEQTGSPSDESSDQRDTDPADVISSTEKSGNRFGQSYKKIRAELSTMLTGLTARRYMYTTPNHRNKHVQITVILFWLVGCLSPYITGIWLVLWSAIIIPFRRYAIWGLVSLILISIAPKEIVIPSSVWGVVSIEYALFSVALVMGYYILKEE